MRIWASFFLVVVLSNLSNQAVAQVGTRVIPPFPAELGLPFWGYSLAVNGSYIASGDAAFNSGQGIVSVFDLKTGATVRTFTGPQASGAFGTAIALRGSELIVGSPNAFGGLGLVSFYDIPSGRLLGVIEPGVLVFGPAISGAFGSSIACDGELIAVGAPQAANSGTARGVVAAIRRAIGIRGDGGGINALVPTDPQNNANFGHSVAVYGSTIAVGAPNFDQPGLADSGKTYLYKGLTSGSGGTLTETVADSSGATAVGASYGWAVALSPSHFIASAPFVSGSTGAVWFLNLLYPSRPAQVQAGTTPLAQFGYSLAASESLVAIGSPAFTPGGLLTTTGQVSIFQEPSDTTPFLLINQGRLERPFLINGSLTGQTVAVSGSRIAGGSPGTGDLVTASFATDTFDSANLIRIEASTGESLPSTFSPDITAFTQAAVSGIDPFQSRTLSAATTSYQTSPRGPANRGQAFLMPYAGSLTYRAPGSLPPTPTALVGNTGNFYGYSPIPTQFRAFTAGTLTESLLFEKGRSLAQVAIKAFSPPRHALAAAPGNEFFTFPATFETKPGGTAVTAASDSGMTLTTPTGSEFLTLQEGVSTFPPTGSTYGQFPGRLSHEYRNLVYPCTLLGSPASIDAALASYDTVTDSFSLVAREGDTAPGATPASASFSAFLGESSDGFGSHRAILFRASLRGPGVSSAANEGLWISDSTLGSAPILIAQKGIPVIALKGSPKITRFLRYGIDRPGAILVLAQLGGTGYSSANNLALIEFRIGSSNATILLQKGSPAPGTNGALLSSIPFLDGRTSGHWTALVTLARSPGRADTSNDLALYTHQTGGISDPVLALRKGTRFKRPGSEILKSILLSASVSDTRSGTLGIGLGHVVGTDRSAAAILTFTDGIQSLSTVNP